MIHDVTSINLNSNSCILTFLLSIKIKVVHHQPIEIASNQIIVFIKIEL